MIKSGCFEDESLPKALGLLLESKWVKELNPSEQLELLARLLEQDSATVSKLLPRFGFAVLGDTMLDPRWTLINGIAFLASGASFDEILVMVKKRSCVGEDRSDLFVELAAALILRLMQCNPSAHQLKDLAGMVEDFALQSEPGEAVLECLTDIFLVLANSEEGEQALEGLQAALLERTTFDSLVREKPLQRHAACMALAACLAARGLATGHLVGTLAQLKRTLICHVYFLLSLSNHEHRRGRSSEASEYLMLAVKLFTTPPLNPEQQLQPWLASAEQAPGVAQAEQVVEAADAHVHGNGVLRNRYVFDPDDLLLPELHRLTPRARDPDHYLMYWIRMTCQKRWPDRV